MAQVTETSSAVESSDKSAFAQYCEKRGVFAIGVYWDKKFVEVLDQAAKAANMKRNEYLLDRAIKAVNADGFKYEAPKVEKPETQAEKIARLERELAQAKASTAQDTEEYTGKAFLPPTPPTMKADEKGKLVAA